MGLDTLTHSNASYAKTEELIQRFQVNDKVKNDKNPCPPSPCPLLYMYIYI